MNDPEEFLQMCFRSIEKNEYEVFDELLEFIPVLEPEESDTIFSNLFKFCSINGNDIIARRTADEWRSRVFPSIYLEENSELKKIELNSTVFQSKNTEVSRNKGNRFLSHVLYIFIDDPDSIKYAIKIIEPESTFFSIVTSLIYDIDRSDVPLLCETLDKLLPSTFDHYYSLYIEAKNLNIGIQTYLEGRLNKFYSDIPSYIDSTTIKVFKEPELTDYPVLSKREACIYVMEMMFPGQKLHGKDFNLALEHLLRKDIDIHKISKNKHFSNVDNFKDYGPSNRNNNINEIEDELCIRYNCRMLLCRCKDGLDDYGEINDWFTGNCDFCHRLIRSRSHCLRLPIITGGWEGCFCSFNCIKSHIEENFECDIETRLMYNIVKQMQQLFKTDKINDTIEEYDDRNDILKMERKCILQEDDLGNISCLMDL